MNIKEIWRVEAILSLTERMQSSTDLAFLLSLIFDALPYSSFNFPKISPRAFF